MIIIIVYVLLAMHYVPIIEPVMDEGTYLLKGKWYWENIYQPFQEKGPLTNKPPLSFYSLGISQILFSRGLESGRYFAVFLGAILLIGQWLTVKRLAGTWWAAASIALYTISPAWIIYYSRAMTQVVTSLLIAWSLYFVLGEDRKQSQLIIGAILAAMVVMVRQNLLPLFMFTLLYILWENGLKKSIVPIFSGLIVFIGFNAIYWPEIYLHIWQPFLPNFFNEIVIDIFRLDSLTGNLGTANLIKKYDLIYELQVLFDGVRYFFIPIMASIIVFIILPIKNLLTIRRYRKVLYLAFNFVFLSIIHYFFAMYENNVLYSFPAYFAFYLPLGTILLPLLSKDIIEFNNKKKETVLILTVILTCTGIGLSLYREIAPYFMNIHLPSFRQRTLFHGPYMLWDVLLNRYNISIRLQEFIIPTCVGLIAGVMIIFWGKVIQRIITHAKGKSLPYGRILIIFIFFLSILITPTFILAGHNSIETCPNSNIPKIYEKAAEDLRSVIPSNSLVYLEGPTPVLFMYLPDIKIFPAQLNMQFNFRDGGDLATIENMSYWNDELAQRWIEESDFLFLDQATYESRFLNLSSELQNDFLKIPNHLTLDPCNTQYTIVILKRTT